MSDLIRIQRQLRKFDSGRTLPLVELEQGGSRLVLDVPFEVERRAEGGLRIAQTLTPLGRPARQLRSRLVFDQDGELIASECRFNQEPTP